MKLTPPRNLVFASALLALVCVGHISAQDKNWRPITKEDLASTPVVEPDADAEALFWEVTVDDSAPNELALKHYVRVKIFTEKGREDFSKHDILFGKNTRIRDVEARVTKPDGTVTYLKKEDVFDREVVKANGFKVSAKSFALPGLEVGSIVEYRYREVQPNAAANMRLYFQRELPIRTISYYVKPFNGDNAMAFQPFNAPNYKFEQQKDGFYRASMNNVPAFHEEPSMLPEDEIRAWLYIYYTADPDKKVENYWLDRSKDIYARTKDDFKANDEVKAAATQAIAGATSDDEKLHRLWDFVKTKIKNVRYSQNVTPDEKKKVAGNKTPADTLKSLVGDTGDIDALFGAMAKAVGYDPRLALSGSREELFFKPQVANLSLMLGSTCVAIKLADAWHFYSPAEYFTRWGMMGWPEEDQTALVTDPKELIFTKIPLSPAELSIEKRSGNFKLLPDGSLEGDARIEYTGHNALVLKLNGRDDSDGAIQDEFKAKIRAKVMDSAEVTDLKIENMRDPERPVVVTFRLRVAGYAAKTGKRIFLQPNVFERSSKPRFTASSRKSEIYFNFPFSVTDEFNIELPAGFKLENADAPPRIADGQGIGSHTITMTIKSDNSLLTYKRTFSFGNKGFIRFPIEAYEPLKSLFGAFNKADVHQVTLRQDGQ